MKKKRAIFFVCSGISDTNELLSKVIKSNSQDEAIIFFEKEFKFKPKTVCGPFYKKFVQSIIDTNKMVISSIWKNAQYNDWSVKANILKEPKDHAYIIFNNRIDGKKMQKPGGIVVVPISDLKGI